LLHPATDLIDHGGAELDHMEGVQHRDRVLELVVDGVLVAVERVQRRFLHTVTELLAALLEPVAVGLAGPARDQIQQPSPWLAIGGGGEVDHPGQLLRAASAVGDRFGGHVMPHVLVDPEPGDPGEPGFVGGHRLQQRLDRCPDRVPSRPELSGESGDAGVLTTHLPDRPPTRPRGQQRPRCRDLLVGLGERPDRTRRLATAPGPLAPHHLDRPPEARRVDQHHVSATVAGRDNPATAAAHQTRRRLHHHPEHTGVLVANDTKDVEPVEPDEQIATRAVGQVVIAARGTARRRLRHQSRPSGWVAWSLPILEASTPLTPASHRDRRAAHPHRNSEEPPIPSRYHFSKPLPSFAM